MKSKSYNIFIIPLFWGSIVLALNTIASGAGRDVVLQSNITLYTIEHFVDAWEDQRHVSVDTRVAPLIGEEVEHFREIFGYEYQGSEGKIPRPSTIVLLNNKEKLQNIIFKYLDDARHIGELTTIMHRLAVQVGFSSINAGWPSTITNQFRSVDFGMQLPSGRFFLESNGKKDHRSTTATTFLALPGEHKIILDDNTRDTWSFIIEGTKDKSTRPGFNLPNKRHSR